MLSEWFFMRLYHTSPSQVHLDHVEELRSAESLDVLPDEIVLEGHRPPPTTNTRS